VADGWCWFVLREEYCWLVAGGWFVVREKYCWLVADKPSEQGPGPYAVVFSFAKWLVGMLSMEGCLSELLSFWCVSGPLVTGWMLEML
jgi:hypothetical protein